MADYTPNVWSSGDVISVSLSNHWETQYSTAKTEFAAGNWTLAGILKPDGHNTRDLGLTGTRFKDLYLGGALYGSVIKGSAAIQLATEAGAAQSLYVKNIKATGSFTDIGSTSGDIECLQLTVGSTPSIVITSAKVLQNVTADAGILTGTIATARLPAATKTIFLSAAGGKPRITNGCALLAWTELATNKHVIPSLDFDTSTDEYAQWLFPMPDGYDGGNLKIKAYWTAANGTGGSSTVAWSLSARTFTDDDALDQALGTAVSSTDTYIAANDLHISPEVTVTPAGTPAGGELMLIQIKRDTANDNLGYDAKLIGVKIEYGTSYSD
jgi:hypothetical protein